jgi:Fe-S cluster assembly scaffold protein SufB
LTAPAARPAAGARAGRPRPARRPLDQLSLTVDETVLEAIAAPSPSWLADDRRAAFAAWADLPGETNLLYTPYIDLRAAQLDGAAVVADPGAAATSGELPADADGLIEIVEGRLTTVELSEAAHRAGVGLRSLLDDVGSQRDLLDGGSTLPANDKFAQLTRALWAQGVVLDVPAGVSLERPIVIRWALGTPDRALLTRTIIRLGDGASASIVEELVASDPVATDGATAASSGQAFFSGTTEVTLGAGASLQVASLQEFPDHVVAIQHRTATVGEDASLQWALAQLGGRLFRSRIDNRLVGDRSSVEQVEIVFGAADQLFDLTSYTTHIGRDTTGDLLSKAALLERARTYLKGLIVIDRSAVGTDSFLGEFGMNLSKAARSVAIPSLEIDQPDCRRAAHASSVGPVDETQMFYLESRGIPPDEARKFIVLGFLEPVVARVPLESARERLRDLLEAKWTSGTASTTDEAAA